MGKPFNLPTEILTLIEAEVLNPSPDPRGMRELLTKGAELALQNNRWVKCQTDIPKDCEDVLVTDGKSVWIGDYNRKRRAGERWSVVYNGAPAVEPENIVAWRLMPNCQLEF